MRNNEFSDKNFWNDGCSSRGACSVSPSIAALQELLLYMIKQVSYYILELDKLNLNNDNLVKAVINSISSLILINELNEKNLYSIVLQNYYALKNAKDTYIKIAELRNEPVNIIEYSVNFSENTHESQAISEGSRLLQEGYKTKSPLIRNHIQILRTVIKSLCLNISKLYNYKICYKFITHTIFEAINHLNSDEIDLYTIKEFVKTLCKKDFRLNLIMAEQLQLNFGKISEVMLSHSSRSGKSVLVSGTNFFDLRNILELAKENNIDVYTHSELLIAHALEGFRRYDNLIGHYGNSTENCIVDFGTFPGAILLTSNSQNNTEFLYRGRIFSNDYNVPQGVIKLENNNYIPVIDSALKSKGFTKGQTRPDTKLGFNEDEIIRVMDDVMQKLADSQIKHLYVIIGNSFSPAQSEYYHTFLNNIDENDFVLSFSYGKSENNKIIVDLGNFYPLITKFLCRVLKNRIKNSRLIFMINSCSPNMISGMILLKEFGAKNVFVHGCSPRQINPSVFETFITSYGINLITSPVEDLKLMRKTT